MQRKLCHTTGLLCAAVGADIPICDLVFACGIVLGARMADGAAGGSNVVTGRATTPGHTKRKHAGSVRLYPHFQRRSTTAKASLSVEASSYGTHRDSSRSARHTARSVASATPTAKRSAFQTAKRRRSGTKRQRSKHQAKTAARSAQQHRKPQPEQPQPVQPQPAHQQPAHASPPATQLQHVRHPEVPQYADKSPTPASARSPQQQEEEPHQAQAQAQGSDPAPSSPTQQQETVHTTSSAPAPAPVKPKAPESTQQRPPTAPGRPTASTTALHLALQPRNHDGLPRPVHTPHANTSGSLLHRGSLSHNHHPLSTHHPARLSSTSPPPDEQLALDEHYAVASAKSVFRGRFDDLRQHPHQLIAPPVRSLSPVGGVMSCCAYICVTYPANS